MGHVLTTLVGKQLSNNRSSSIKPLLRAKLQQRYFHDVDLTLIEVYRGAHLHMVANVSLQSLRIHRHASATGAFLISDPTLHEDSSSLMDSTSPHNPALAVSKPVGVP
jgi:hypothetical protein